MENLVELDCDEMECIRGGMDPLLSFAAGFVVGCIAIGLAVWLRR